MVFDTPVVIRTVIEPTYINTTIKVITIIISRYLFLLLLFKLWLPKGCFFLVALSGWIKAFKKAIQAGKNYHVRFIALLV